MVYCVLEMLNFTYLTYMHTSMTYVYTYKFLYDSHHLIVDMIV